MSNYCTTSMGQWELQYRGLANYSRDTPISECYTAAQFIVS